ncbi:ChaN family lipoprotein [Endozoicomonadaceae bacterium StTr2]
MKLTIGPAICLSIKKRWLASLAAVVLLTGCTGNLKQQAEPRSASFQGEDIVETASGKTLDYGQLLSKLQQADYILLGENHDNSWHHDRQLAIVKDLQKAGWLKQLSMEMMTPAQQEGADTVVAERSQDVDKIRKILNWSERWEWKFYGPIISHVVAQGIPLKTANLERDQLMAIYRQPDAVQIPDVLNKAALELTRERIVESHCGNIPADRINSMVMIQRARDDAMAASLLQAKTGALLLAGNWHTRNDLGVPRYLAEMAPGKKVISLGFVEQDDAEEEQSTVSDSQYDVVWVTPAVERNIELCGKPKG